MKINYGTDFDPRLSYQNGFPETLRCYRCNSEMLPMVQVDDNEGMVVKKT